jgi:L-asparaginase
MNSKNSLEPRRLAVLGLGGTISMRPEKSGAVPGLTAEDLVAGVPQQLRVQIRHIENFRQLPGAHLGLEDLVELAQRIRQLTEREKHQGCVVIQGTDTIEETVFALDLLVDGHAPVVVTGAMRHAGQISPDGAGNIANALSLAASPFAGGRGAMVCFNDEIHAAWAVQKAATSNVAAFLSPGFGPVGQVVEGRVRLPFGSGYRAKPDLDTKALKPARVAIVAASLGEGPDLVEVISESGYAGLVVQALGAGHLPATWVGPLERLTARMPVVLATRVARGPVLESTYAFPGSETDLLARGLLSAGYLTPAKARVLLSFALGGGLDREHIESLFQAYCGYAV